MSLAKCSHTTTSLDPLSICSRWFQEEHLNTETPQPSSEVEELEIALLQCAMEYELKVFELKMYLNVLEEGKKGA
jgi:hypothetical protein